MSETAEKRVTQPSINGSDTERRRRLEAFLRSLQDQPSVHDEEWWEEFRREAKELGTRINGSE